MAKDYGNIVFYRTKNGKLRWFDPTKIPGGHPREKKVAKAVENKKAFRSDENRNLNDLKKSQSTRNLRNAKDNVRTARNKYEDAQYETQSAFKWGTGRFGRTPQEEKAEMKKAGTAVNQAENAERRALNEARRADPETFGKNRRDQQNINRAKKKIEQNKAYEVKHPRSAIEAAKFNQQSAAPVQPAQKEVRRTQMTPEREERAARALAKKQFNKEAIAQVEAYDREDAAAKRTRNANTKLMNEEGNWDRTGGNNREDIIAARRELKKAGNAWRAASNDSERADLEAKRAANTLNQNKITDRDQRNIERAMKRAEERQHIADVKKAVEKSPYVNPNFDYDKYGKYFDVLKDGTVGIKDRNKMSELTNKLYGHNLNARSALVQNAAMEDFQNRAKAKTAAAAEPEKKQQSNLGDPAKSGKKAAIEVNPKWNEYDRTVGKQHLANYGRIYLDDYGVPVDNEYEAEERHRAYQRTRKRKKAWKD